ncbi:MAG: hypothetical protein IJ435_03630 [Clostridia bacterium]|nr:hypothetical protein [Clostridia bacterium]
MKERIAAFVEEAFSECYTLDDVARLYFDIRMECEKQLSHMNLSIAKEMKANGVLEEE